MPTECSAELFKFARVESRVVLAGFDGGAISSDAGALLLGATDRACRLPPKPRTGAQMSRLAPKSATAAPNHATGGLLAWTDGSTVRRRAMAALRRRQGP